ncbi:hypothetical protein ONZ45_g12152 [Pleurotus djamor]|nr:hypothetical protein ONZ45_g12152 [Pleurotus djamor]
MPAAPTYILNVTPRPYPPMSHRIENMNTFGDCAPCRLDIVLALALDMEAVDAGGGGGIERSGEESNNEDIGLDRM